MTTAPDVSHDPRVELREFVAEMVGMAMLHGEIVQRFAFAGDDVGTQYALRRMVAHVRAAVGVFNDLVETNKHLEAEKAADDARAA